jgi:hypothetical protein
MTLQLQKRYHDEAYRQLSMGLDLEDQNNPDEAEKYYERGLEVLNMALELKYQPEEM